MQGEKQQRETKEIILSISKSKIKIYSYLIARDLFDIDATNTKEIIKSLVYSFNEEIDKEKILENILDLRIEDYRQLDAEITNLINPKEIEDKKKQ